jgi:tripartite-type tricarboxylate transporter receptor subunit TctC
MKPVCILAAIVMTLASASAALGQSFPSKPVRLIMPFPAGSASDSITRALHEKLAETWGQPVVIENRPGGGGVIAASAVAKSQADGHTLLVHAGLSAQAALGMQLPYDALKDFVAIAPLASQTAILFVRGGSNITTVAELIAAAKTAPGRINYGGGQIGTMMHLAAERFRLEAGIDVVHIPHKGGPELIAEVLGERIDYGLLPITVVLPLVRQGKLLALAVSSGKRLSVLPELPTIAEAGFAGFDHKVCTGLWAPAGTPAQVVSKIAKDIARVLAVPEVRDRLARFGAEEMSMTPAEFSRFVRGEIDTLSRIAKAAGVKLE